MNAPKPAIEALSGAEKRALLARLLREKSRSRRTFPVSFAQQRLWFLHQLEPASLAYHIAIALRLVGSLNVSVLERCLREIVRRHGALRTTFDLRDGEPMQVVASELEVELASIDLRHLDEGRRRAELERLATVGPPRFDLVRGPLCRFALVVLAEGESVLLQLYHHIVMDGWSGAVFMAELTALYRALCAGRPAPLPALPIQYADFALWQRNWLRGERSAEQLGYWRRRLHPLPDAVALPADHPRPPAGSSPGIYRRFRLAPAATEEVEALSRRRRVTLFMTLLAAFQALLAACSGQCDVVVGSPIAGRNRRQLEDLIGFFVNMLVLRSDLGGRPSFDELLDRVREVTLGAYAHQDLPFEYLVHALQPDRDLGTHPLFQVVFQVQNAPPVALDLAGLRVSPVHFDRGMTRFDLELHVWREPAALQCVFFYNARLFDSCTIERLWRRFRNLLAGAVAAPQRPLAELGLMAAAERHQLLVEWGDAAREPAPAPLVHRLFAEQAKRTPDAVAVVLAGEALSYGELDRRGNRLAHSLRTAGLERGGIAGLFLEPSPEMVVAILGVLKAGGAYLPLDPSHPPERLSAMIEDAGAALVVSRKPLVPRLASSPARIVRLDRDGPAIAAQPPDPPAGGAGPEDPAYVIYTSGSTGRPKGVMVLHRNAARLFAATQPWFGFGPAEVWTLFHSYAFDFSVWEIWGALVCGGRLVVVPYWVRRSPAELLELLERERVTVLNQTPSAFRQLLRVEAGVAAEKIGSLRWVIFGGEALDVGSLEPWFARHGDRRPRLVNMYGITETTVHVTYRPLRRADLGPACGSPLGRPIPDLRLCLLDPALEPVPLGVYGELCVAGAGVARGYLGRPRLTAERFVPDPFGRMPGERLYRTGDRVRYLADGELEFAGRTDHQVKIRGFRIEPGEIEAALLRHPAVREAAVAARELGPGDVRLVAWVVPEPTRSGPGRGWEDLRGHLAEKLPEYMVPAVFAAVEELPRTAGGKVDRRALPLPRPQGDAGDEALAAPRGHAERVLAEIWSEVLRVPRVGRDSNFFALGGDSILSIRVVTRARQAGLPLSPRQIFQHQTLAALAQAAGAAEAVAAEQGPISGRVPLTPIQHWFFAQEPAQPDHFNQAFLLRLRQPPSFSQLERGLGRLLAHHDALRSRYARTATGWRQEIVALAVSVPLIAIDLSALPPNRRRATLEAAAARLQASLELAVAPLLRAALFDLGAGERRLLLILHHLVVDGVSWRILFEDLEAACADRELPPKTTSYRRWAEELERHAHSPELRSELGYWLAGARAGAPQLPPAAAGGTVLTSLDPQETRALLREVPAACGARLEHVLLAALVEAFAPASGERRLLVELEKHGREEVFEGIDLARTVGWFTSIFPILLDLTATTALGDGPAAIREQLDAVPRRGLGYGLLRYLSNDPEIIRSLEARPRPQVSFNYLGDFDAATAGGGLEPVIEPIGPSRSPLARRCCALEINGLVLGGRLQWSWTYGDDHDHRATVEGLAQRFADTLRRFIAGVESAATAVPAPAAEESYPLSPMQQGMLFHSLSSPGSGAYFNQFTFTIGGRLDAAAFARAWQQVADRHTALRTRFLWEGLPEPLQVLARRAPIPWEHHDWRDLPEAAQQERLESLLRADRRRGFELARAPLLRHALIRTAGERWLWIWSSHHLLLDGWSVALVLREVLGRYQACRRGEPGPAAPGSAFGDYIAWLGRRDRGRAEIYWRRALAGFRAPTPLGIDRAPAGPEPGREEDYAERARRLPALPESALESAARRHRVTLNTLIQGAWALLLSHYSGEREVLFGATVAGRPADLPGVESMVGVFINTLPVRVRLAAGVRLPEWLRALQHEQAAARRYEFSSLIEIQGWSEVPRGQPLFESVLVFENYPRASGLSGPGMELDAVRAFERSDLPLSLTVVPGEGLACVVIGDRRRFDPTALERLLGHFQTLLAGMPAHGGAPEELPWLTRAERHQLLSAWNEARGSVAGGTVVERFEAWARQTPEAVAASFGESVRSYREIDRQADRRGHSLRALGVGPDVLVAVCLEPSAELVIALLAILKAGGAYLPLDPDDPPSRLRFMLEDAACRVVLTRRALSARIPPSPAAIVCMDDAPHGTAEPAARPAPATGDALAYVNYTSGSTGRPKGVAVPHRAVVRLVCGPDYVELGPGDRLAQAANVSFDATTFELWGALANGACVVGIPREIALVPAALAAEIRRRRISAMFLTTALLNQIVHHAPVTFQPLRSLLFGGEEVDPGVVRTLLRAGPPERLLHVYGPTENTTFSSWQPVVGVAAAAITVPIGRPISGTRLYLLDRELRPVAAGVRGELYTGGEGLARGYLGRPELTAEKFVPDPFGGAGDRLYATGDLARFSPRGEIEFLGRRDAQVKLRGFRVEPGEIAAVLRECPRLRQAVVVVREHVPGERLLVAYTVPAGEVPAVSELRRWVTERLPAYMVPAIFISLEALPVTATGKVDRQALPAPEGLGPRTDAVCQSPRNAAERLVAGIWKEVLGVAQVGIHDNFFELGGHSLHLIRVHSRLQEARGRKCPISDLFQYSTVRALAGHLEPGAGPEPAAPAAEPTEVRDARRQGAHRRRRTRLEHRLGQETGEERS